MDEPRARVPILIVEDDVELSSLMTDVLTEAGFDPIATQNVREATFKLKNEEFVCIILDMCLGEENGDGVIEFVRKNHKLPNHDTPILVVSGYLEKDLVEKIAPSIQGALVKPFDMKVLVEQTRKLIHAGLKVKAVAKRAKGKIGAEGG